MNKNKTNGIVDVSEKKNIKICIPKEPIILDSEIISIQNRAQQQREEIKTTYYSANTPILNTINRGFSELFKHFINLKLGGMSNTKTLQPKSKF